MGNTSRFFCLFDLGFGLIGLHTYVEVIRVIKGTSDTDTIGQRKLGEAEQNRKKVDARTIIQVNKKVTCY